MQPSHAQTRLEQLSDGVFAIAITLLALELKVPELAGKSLEESVSDIFFLAPTILTFFLSFITIAIFWVNHHQLTRAIGVLKRRILWSNVLVLFFITLIPFATAVIGENPMHTFAVMGYALVLLGASLSFSLMRYFVHKSIGETHIPLRRSLVGPVCYSLAVITSFASIWVAYVFLVIPAIFYFLPKIREANV